LSPAEIPRAVILGCAGPRLGPEERDLFAATRPLGFILFGRNCETPDQVRALVADLRAAVGRADAPVLIDQEGGRVARLRPPHWRAMPAAARVGAIADHDPILAREAAWLCGRLIAADLRSLGISVDCAPLLDVPAPSADTVIGDRAFASEPALVADLGRAFRAGLEAGGVTPVIKHIPGHGRALVDSHHRLPRVEASLADLAARDFVPFRALADAPWAMTAHVVYAAVDDRPATLSAALIERVIRGALGFDGVLISDDLSMNALSGTLAERTLAALAAGCDLALHCNGDLDEMRAVAAVAPTLSPVARERLGRAEAARRPPEPFDAAAGAARLAALLDSGAERARA